MSTPNDVLVKQLKRSEDQRKYLADKVVELEKENKKANYILNSIMDVFYSKRQNIDLKNILIYLEQLKEDTELGKALKLAFLHSMDLRNSTTLIYGKRELLDWYNQQIEEGEQ